MDPYEELANAIILQATKDYRLALRKLAKHPYNRIGLSEKEEIEQFFRSNWFTILTGIDPELLIEKLKAEVM
jgi:hypothetical protein